MRAKRIGLLHGGSNVAVVLLFGWSGSATNTSISEPATAIALATLDSTAVTVSIRFAPAKNSWGSVRQDLEFAFVAVRD
jgi:hypothetical protein